MLAVLEDDIVKNPPPLDELVPPLDERILVVPHPSNNHKKQLAAMRIKSAKVGTDFAGTSSSPFMIVSNTNTPFLLFPSSLLLFGAMR
mmetsp:Transcript_3551/g.7842  ORF Transcript_3551/g.7842 Transcript_3551/m.7842 type:complete len:88 (+) Transcript_3551:540-803(+)